MAQMGKCKHGTDIRTYCFACDIENREHKAREQSQKKILEAQIREIFKEQLQEIKDLRKEIEELKVQMHYISERTHLGTF